MSPEKVQLSQWQLSSSLLSLVIRLGAVHSLKFQPSRGSVTIQRRLWCWSAAGPDRPAFRRCPTLGSHELSGRSTLAPQPSTFLSRRLCPYVQPQSSSVQFLVVVYALPRFRGIFSTMSKKMKWLSCCRRRQAGLPPLPDAELASAIRKLTLGAAALNILVPSSMSLSKGAALQVGRQCSERSSALYTSRYEVSPEKAELARRQLALSLRVAAYSTMATVVALGGVVTAAAWRWDLRSWEDCKGALRAWGQRTRPWLQDTMRPWRDSAERWAQKVRPGEARGGAL
jgi:hypothetical protein